MLEVIKVKHRCVIPGDKYVPLHSPNWNYIALWQSEERSWKQQL